MERRIQKQTITQGRSRVAVSVPTIGLAVVFAILLASDRFSARKHPMEYYRDQALQANGRIADGCPTRLSAGTRWRPSHGQK